MMFYFNSIFKVEKEVILENVTQKNHKQILIYILDIKEQSCSSTQTKHGLLKIFLLE